MDRSWGLLNIVEEGAYRETLTADMHRTIQKVGEDIDSLKANTAIAALMTLLNKFYDSGKVTSEELKTFILLLNPFAPHLTEEMWEAQGFGGVVTDQSWPQFDPDKCRDETVEIAVQVNGKIKTRLTVDAAAGAADVLALAKADEKVAPFVDGKTIVKELYVPGRLVNIVVKM